MGARSARVRVAHTAQAGLTGMLLYSRFGCFCVRARRECVSLLPAAGNVLVVKFMFAVGEEAVPSGRAQGPVPPEGQRRRGWALGLLCPHSGSLAHGPVTGVTRSDQRP